jgi:hypothetical protein
MVIQGASLVYESMEYVVTLMSRHKHISGIAITVKSSIESDGSWTFNSRSGKGIVKLYASKCVLQIERKLWVSKKSESLKSDRFAAYLRQSTETRLRVSK